MTAMPFNIEILILPSISILFIGFLILFFLSRNILISTLVPLIKTLIFILYFAVFFDGTFTFLDDWHYLEKSLEYMNSYNNIFQDILEPHKLAIFFNTNHFFYFLWNIFSFKIYGSFYFSPVVLNIILTFFISFVLYKLLIEIGIVRKYAIWFGVFYLIHWNTLSWSSILNFKDFLVQFLLILSIYLIILYEKYKKIIYIVSIFIIFVIFETIRFYIPFLIALSYLIFKIILFHKKHRNTLAKMMVEIFIISIAILFLSIILLKIFKNELILLQSNFVNPLYGIIRYTLTPIPFHMEEAYNFLIFASFLDWLSFPFLLTGIYFFCRLQNKYFVFILITIITIIIFYSIYGELQGPRHKIQIYTFISIFQMCGLLVTLYGFKRTKEVIYKCKK